MDLDAEDELIVPPDLDDMLYGSLGGVIIGMKFYKAVVGRNDSVAFQREPTNKFDNTAIKVFNIIGTQVCLRVIVPFACSCDSFLSFLWHVLCEGRLSGERRR